MVLAAMPGMKYKSYTLNLQRGDALFVYTDGVPEANSSTGSMFGTDRMPDALNADPAGEPREQIGKVGAAIRAFTAGADQFDDITMLALDYYGPQV